MKNSLFLKVFISIVIVSSVILGISFYFLKSYQENNLFENLETFTSQLSNTIKGTLYHAMLNNKRDEIQNILESVSKQKGIENVFILDKTGKIIYSPFQEEIGKTLDKNDTTCKICHAASNNPKVKTIIYEKQGGEKVFRNVNPIYSAPACYRCHDSKERIRGILITDIPVTNFEEQIKSNLKIMSQAALIVFIALGTIIFYSISKLILAPLNTLVSGTKEISSGNLNYQISINRSDEMGVLVSSFNSMTNSLKESRGELLKTIEEVNQRNEELMTLYNLIQQITSTLELEELKPIVLNIISDALNPRESYLVIFNYKTNTAELSLKNKDSSQIQQSTIDFSFTFYETLNPESILTSKELKEKLQFYKRIAPVTDNEGHEIISFPLQVKNTIVGIIGARKDEKHKFPKTEIRLFESLSRSLTVSIQNSLLYKMSTTDGLTGLYAKSFFERTLELEIERSKRLNRNISLIILDVDDFKSINDKYGHDTGDLALVTISSCIKKSIRSMDIPCRFGGDEFTIILPDADSIGAQHTAERIMMNLKNSSTIQDSKGENIQLTISIGHATYPENANSYKDLFVIADKALYRAKNSGKNKIAAYSKME